MAGSLMTTADLREYPLFSNVSRPRVARHMKEMGCRRNVVLPYSISRFVVCW